MVVHESVVHHLFEKEFLGEEVAPLELFQVGSISHEYLLALQTALEGKWKCTPCWAAQITGGWEMG